MRAADVPVTGLAWVTPLGDDLDGVWDRLLAGESGVRAAPAGVALTSELAAVVPDVDLARGAHDRQVEIAVRALAAALAGAGVAADDPRLRLVVGTSYGPFLDEPAGRLDDWAVAVADRVGHPRRPICVGTACSAGSDSILVAADLIRSGVADVCVAGGADVVTLAKRLGHSALGTMSAGQLRAFDQRHDGMVPGEGAAFLVLESQESANRRSAPIHAVLCGAGSSNDAAGLTAPDASGDSVVHAVRRCLEDAGRTAADVALISAHATGTPLNDAVETTSLRRIFAGDEETIPPHSPTVFATKGALGHSLGATGAIEAVSVILALRSGKVPPISGLTSPLPDFPLPLAAGAAVPVAADAGSAGISLTIGFGGFNTCLLFEKAG